MCSLDLSLALYLHGVPTVPFVGVTVVLDNSEVFKKNYHMSFNTSSKCNRLLVYVEAESVFYCKPSITGCVRRLDRI